MKYINENGYLYTRIAHGFIFRAGWEKLNLLERLGRQA